MSELGVDIGGTFTDVVMRLEDGTFRVSKLLTSYPDLTRAFLKGVHELAAESLPVVERIAHGTTIASNAVIERKGSRTALITTAGFRDVLIIGRQRRFHLYDLQQEKPQPLVPRRLIREVPERVLANGQISVPLDEDCVRSVARWLQVEDIESIAVCLLHSYANPVHERRIAEIIREECGEDTHVSLSSDVSPQFREYERTSTTVINAYLMPVVQTYLRQLVSELRESGYQKPLFVMQSGGGLLDARLVRHFPVRMIDSGPAAAVLMAVRYGQMTGHEDLISFDMGGTTAKLSLILGGGATDG